MKKSVAFWNHINLYQKSVEDNQHVAKNWRDEIVVSTVQLNENMMNQKLINLRSENLLKQ